MSDKASRGTTRSGKRFTRWEYWLTLFACANIFYVGAERVLRALWILYSSGSWHTLYYDFLSKGSGGRTGALARMTTPAEALRGGELFFSVVFMLYALFFICFFLLHAKKLRDLKPQPERETRDSSTCGD